MHSVTAAAPGGVWPTIPHWFRAPLAVTATHFANALLVEDLFVHVVLQTPEGNR